jgi:hypothetical protein
LFNSHFKFSAGKLASKWEGTLVVQEVYRSGAIHLHGDIKGKPHVVNGKLLQHYIAGEKLVGKIDVVHLQSPEAYITKKYPLFESQNQ